MGKGVHWKWTTKQLHRWHISIWKALAIASLGNCKLKHHEVPLHRDQNDWHRKRGCTHWWAGEQKGSRYSEYFINCTVFYVLQWAEDLRPDSSPYEGVCSRLIHRHSDTQPNEMHVSRWTQHGASVRPEATTHHWGEQRGTWDSQWKWSKTDWKGFTVKDSNTTF